jgi:hypothetical protein
VAPSTNCPCSNTSRSYLNRVRKSDSNTEAPIVSHRS